MKRIFVVHPIGVRQAADLNALKIDVYGRPQRRVHLQGSEKPVWVDAAQVRLERFDAQQARRIAMTYRDRLRANMTIVDALVELDRIGALHKVEQGLLNHFHKHGLPVEMVDEEWVLRAPEERAINLTELATAVLDHFTSEGP